MPSSLRLFILTPFHPFISSCFLTAHHPPSSLGLYFLTPASELPLRKVSAFSRSAFSGAWCIHVTKLRKIRLLYEA